MKFDHYSNPIFEDLDIQQLLYQGHAGNIDKVIVARSDETDKLSKNIKLKFDNPSHISIEEYDTIAQAEWFADIAYQEFDIYKFCLALCATENEQIRVLEELKLYEEKNMITLLQVLKYTVDHLRKNNIVWGVGRGSSVASFVLYLLGVHKINSIQYKLDYKEFLR